MSDVPMLDDLPMLEEAIQTPSETLNPELARLRFTSELFKPRTLKDALTATVTSPPWVIQDLLLKDSATLVSAHPHLMKSLSWLCACMEAVAKRLVWGRFPAPGVERTVFIETEDPQWMVEGRIRGIAKGLGIAELPGFHYFSVGPFNLVDNHQEVKRLLEHYQPHFAVLSTLQSIIGDRDWSRQNAMADVNALIVNLSRICPLAVITHSPWNKRERRAAGTITQAANYATSIHYAKVQNSSTHETVVHVSVDSKAGAVETSFSLKLESEGSPREADSVRSVVYAGKGWPKGCARDAVLEALEDDPDLSNREIAERVGCSVRNVQKIRKRLTEEGRLVRHEVAENED